MTVYALSLILSNNTVETLCLRFNERSFFRDPLNSGANVKPVKGDGIQ